MDLQKCTSHSEEYLLCIVTNKGFLKILYVPFQVICVQSTDILELNVIFYVEALSAHKLENSQDQL